MRLFKTCFLIIVLLGWMTPVAASQPPIFIRYISLSEAYDLWQSKTCDFIDMRPLEEFNRGHILRAISVPFVRLKELDPASSNMDKPVVVYTRYSMQNGDDMTMARQLFKLGFKQVYVFVGGFKEWQNAQYPVN